MLLYWMPDVASPWRPLNLEVEREYREEGAEELRGVWQWRWRRGVQV
jgi:hypothetical protein